MFVKKIFVFALAVLLAGCGPLVDLDRMLENVGISRGPGNGPVIPAPVITITTQPAATTIVTAGSISGNLIVAADVTQGVALSYQWFINTTNNNVGGSEISGATSASFAIPTGLTAGIYFYFVEVRAFGADSVRSSVSVVDVLPPPVAMTMVRIPPDHVSGPPFDFTMGDDDTQSWNAQPAHEVRLTQGFYMGVHEVTQTQFEEVMGFNPSGFRSPNLPVESVNWYHAIVFSNRLSIRNGLSPVYYMETTTPGVWSTNPDLWGEIPTGSNVRWDAVEIVPGSTGYRLPTEAQWEFAARAGTTTPWNTGDEITIDDANFMRDENCNEIPGALGRTSEVGDFAPNAWGLYDMHGNVWERVWDWFDSYANLLQFEPAPRVDPLGASSGTRRVIRGGGWADGAQGLRSAPRSYDDPGCAWNSIGFRVVRP